MYNNIIFRLTYGFFPFISLSPPCIVSVHFLHLRLSYRKRLFFFLLFHTLCVRSISFRFFFLFQQTCITPVDSGVAINSFHTPVAHVLFYWLDKRAYLHMDVFFEVGNMCVCVCVFFFYK